ncbi:unnamed protein product [Amoebophrya sp. A120]|nr:unnamed protein product [Amoebophrya sp. A120]|eukprot:GSA120T00002209001.1
MSTAGITLKATQADGFYFPPEFDPQKHGSIDKFRRAQGFEHALGKNRTKNLHKGILQIRFEIPFKVKCCNCGNFIGQGTRFDADKKNVGHYFTTPIYEFRMYCGEIVDISQSVNGKTHCNQEWVIRTDPKNCDYELVSGCERPKGQSGFRSAHEMKGVADVEKVTELDPLYMDLDARREMKNDPMFRLEKLAELQQQKFAKAHPELNYLPAARPQVQDAASVTGGAGAPSVTTMPSSSSSTTTRRAMSRQEDEDDLDEAGTMFDPNNRGVDDLDEAGTMFDPNNRGRMAGAGAPHPDDDEHILLTNKDRREKNAHLQESMLNCPVEAMRNKRAAPKMTTEEADQLRAQEASLLGPQEKRRRADAHLQDLYKLRHKTNRSDFSVNSQMRKMLRTDKKNDKAEKDLIAQTGGIAGRSKILALANAQLSGNASLIGQLKQSRNAPEPASGSARPKVFNERLQFEKDVERRKVLNKDTVLPRAQQRSGNFGKMEDKFALFKACQSQIGRDRRK